MYTGAEAGVQSHAQGQGKAPMCSGAFADAGGVSVQSTVCQAKPIVTQFGRRLACSAPLAMEKFVHSECRTTF